MSIRVGDNIIAGGGMPINKSALYLFDFKWSDHLVNQQEWLRADTFTWHDGTVYQNAYQHLVDDIDGKTAQTETIAGTTITFYLADDGHKIVDSSQEANVGQIFLDTGVAWYYILDQTNTRFKLPRTEFGFVGVRGNVGDYVKAGLPNITGTIEHVLGDRTGISSANAFSGSASIGTNGNNRSWNDGVIWFPRTKVTFNASNSNSIYGSSTTVQSPATQMYLYFYVGEFTQTATQNTAGLNAELFNSKADVSSVAHVVVEFQAPTANNNYTWYRKYADGWVEQGGQFTAQGGQYAVYQVTPLPVTMANNNYYANGIAKHSSADTTLTVSIDSTTTTTTVLGIRKHWSSTGQTIVWEVKGMAA